MHCVIRVIATATEYTGIAMEKKLLLCVAAAALLAGCASSVMRPVEPSERGWVTRDIFEQPAYAPFKAGYDTARVAQEFVAMIRGVHQGIDVTVFFGGWCGDSKREVPRFLRLADEAGIPGERIRFYALDRTKKSADGLTEKFGITLVPTFIFQKDGVEVGRITESPTVTLEADVLKILAGARMK